MVNTYQTSTKSADEELLYKARKKCYVKGAKSSEFWIGMQIVLWLESQVTVQGPAMSWTQNGKAFFVLAHDYWGLLRASTYLLDMQSITFLIVKIIIFTMISEISELLFLQNRCLTLLVCVESSCLLFSASIYQHCSYIFTSALSTWKSCFLSRL